MLATLAMFVIEIESERNLWIIFQVLLSHVFKSWPPTQGAWTQLSYRRDRQTNCIFFMICFHYPWQKGIHTYHFNIWTSNMPSLPWRLKVLQKLSYTTFLDRQYLHIVYRSEINLYIKVNIFGFYIAIYLFFVSLFGCLFEPHQHWISYLSVN